MAGLAKVMNRMAEAKRFHAKAAKVAKEKGLKISCDGIVALRGEGVALEQISHVRFGKKISSYATKGVLMGKYTKT